MSAEGGFQILIAGLGLIGGSLAQSLAGFRGARVYGFDRDEAVLRQAEHDGAICKGFTDASEISQVCDLVIVCLFPEAAVEFINATPFREDAVITDVCGVKRIVLERLRGGLRFVGGHPMAGRESGGYKSASNELFLGATYLITPDESDPEAAALVREMANYIGCKEVVETTPEEHDRMVAFTSQLMHVVAYALCDDPQFAPFARYGAGSLRDCTRVAESNPDMWVELFLDNRAALSESVGMLEKELELFRELIADGDRDALTELLHRAAEKKRRHKQTDDNRFAAKKSEGKA